MYTDNHFRGVRCEDRDEITRSNTPGMEHLSKFVDHWNPSVTESVAIVAIINNPLDYRAFEVSLRSFN